MKYALALIAMFISGCASIPVLEINIRLYNPGIKINGTQMGTEAPRALSGPSVATDIPPEGHKNEGSTSPLDGSISLGSPDQSGAAVTTDSGI